jgi:fructokinase
VFFFDRVSRGSLILARAASERDAVVVFEPSGIGNPTLFREACSLAHIVKYSHERMRDLAELETKRPRQNNVLLEIETLGSEGLRFRTRLPKTRTGGWRNVDAFRLDSVTDAAGAGDWCTAGLIDKLARGGADGLREVTSGQLVDALRFGQALAAWNCGYEGARGGMYQVDFPAFQRQVLEILDGSPRAASTPDVLDPSLAEVVGCLCPACKRPDFLVGPRRSRPDRVVVPR